MARPLITRLDEDYDQPAKLPGVKPPKKLMPAAASTPQGAYDPVSGAQLSSGAVAGSEPLLRTRSSGLLAGIDAALRPDSASARSLEANAQAPAVDAAAGAAPAASSTAVYPLPGYAGGYGPGEDPRRFEGTTGAAPTVLTSPNQVPVVPAQQGNGITFGMERPGMQRFALEAAARQASEGRPQDEADIRSATPVAGVGYRGDIPDLVAANISFELAKARPDVQRLEALARTQQSFIGMKNQVDNQNANNRGIAESANAAQSRSLAGKAGAETQSLAQAAPGALAQQAATTAETHARTGSLSEQARRENQGTATEAEKTKAAALSNVTAEQLQKLQQKAAAGDADAIVKLNEYRRAEQGKSGAIDLRELAELHGKYLVAHERAAQIGGPASAPPMDFPAFARQYGHSVPGASSAPPPEGSRGTFNGKPGVIKNGKFVPD